MTDGWGKGDTDRLEHLAAYALALGSDGKPLAVFFDGDLRKRLEILFDVSPLEAVTRRFDPPVEFLALAAATKLQGKGNIFITGGELMPPFHDC